MRRALIALVGVLLLASCAAVDATPPVDAATRVTLERTPCFGFCPDYVVTINGAGEVTYTGRRFVHVKGVQRAQIPQAEVARLLARFDAVNFTSLHDEYRAHVTDLPTTTITLVRNGRTKRVLDYGGTGAGMPEAVRELQEEIDRVANTAQWVRKPNGEPVRTP